MKLINKKQKIYIQLSDKKTNLNDAVEACKEFLKTRRKVASTNVTLLMIKKNRLFITQKNYNKIKSSARTSRKDKQEASPLEKQKQVFWMNKYLCPINPIYKMINRNFKMKSDSS